MTTNPTPKKPWKITDILDWGVGIVAGIICLAGLVGICLLLYQVNRMTTTLQFDLQETVQELTDEVALSYARQAMVRTGYDLKEWDWERTDNERINLAEWRNWDDRRSNPNRSVIRIIKKESQKRRLVFVEATGKTLTVRIQKSKEDFDD